jgi:endonuclease/exonuclease/phosphatase family metal-dependent hydrolase
MAEILSWFDIIAVQEVRDNFADLAYVVKTMGRRPAYVMSDASGNNERMAFVNDQTKLTLSEEIGEVAFPPTQLQHVKVTGVTRAFPGFDRTPYLATFVADQFSILLVNVHLFYGSEKKADIERRALETAAVARWARLRSKSKYATTRDLLALGDFNMPKRAAGKIVYTTATCEGLHCPNRSTQVASSIASDNQYDQVLFFPERTEDRLSAMGVFDYDAVIFRTLWEKLDEDPKRFAAYLRYYMSDHRPFWCQVSTEPSVPN